MRLKRKRQRIVKDDLDHSNVLKQCVLSVYRAPLPAVPVCRKGKQW